ncbi:MAG: TlpA family protein disulfide reductase [Alistipes sp.]|nr:TlpA family protein disulfide reductase [Alistipes sp.]
MLVVLVGLVVAIIFWPVEETAKTEEVVAPEEEVVDEVAAATIIHAGDVAPDFTVEMLDGSTVTLSALRGKPTLLIFWATWCPPCREELHHLEDGIINVYGDTLNVLPISRGEERATVEEYIAKMGYTFAVGLDGDQSAYKKYATNYIPRCFVIDGDGVVVYSGVGYDEAIAEEVNNAIKAINK